MKKIYTLPKCVDCKKNKLVWPYYATDKGFVCNSCWYERERIEKIKTDSKNAP